MRFINKKCNHHRIIYRLVAEGTTHKSEYVCCGCNQIMDVKERPE